MSNTGIPASRRHCMIVHSYYPLGEIRVQRETKALVDSGFEVDVICLRRSGEPAQESEHNVRIYRMPVKRHKQYGVFVQLLEYLTFFVLAAYQLSKLHLKHWYKTVQVHNLPDFLVFAALVSKLLGARVILDLHDLMPEFYAARFGGDINMFPVKVVRWQEKLSCWFADHVITVTEAWRQTLIERGVPPTKCSVVMNLPDPSIFQTHEAKMPVNSLVGTVNGSFQLFYHGNVTYRYGLDILVKAFAIVYKSCSNARLMIHGRGDYQLELEALIDRLGLNEVVTLNTELLPLEELVTRIASANLAVVPNRYDVFTDGILPTKLMEYAVLGIPTITSYSSAIRSYFSNEMVYFVHSHNEIEWAEAITEVMNDNQKLKQLSDNIRKFNQTYSWLAEAKRYVHVVESLRRGESGLAISPS